MTINELAKKINLPLVRVKAMAEELFGTTKNLTDEQLEKITDKLQSAAEVAALPSSEQVIELAEIRAISPTEAHTIERTIAIVGVTRLIKSRDILERLLANDFIRISNNVDMACDALETRVTQRISRTYDNISKNLLAVQQEFTAESFIDKVETKKESRFTDEELDYMRLELDLM